MTINTIITIGGSELFPDSSVITKALGETNISSTFTANVDNYGGGSSALFNIGDEVVVKSDKDDATPSTVIFTGILENIQTKGKELKELLTLSGRDYSARLIDRTVEPEVYTSLPAGSIVKDIIGKYTNDITVTNVSDGDIIDRIVFNQKPVYDAINQLANSTNFMFYVDDSKDLHFEEKSTVSSGKTFSSGNIINTNFKDRRDEVYNQIWVYGDRYLDGFNETFTGDGTGSVFTLLYSPNNVSVTVDATSVQPGGIFQMASTAGSDVKFLVSFEDKEIIFTSGTEQGDNIPANETDVNIDYYRDLPIVKVGNNDDSISRYGQRVKVIQDKNIKDPKTAELIMLRELEEFSDPLKQGQILVNGVDNIIVGETCVVDIPLNSINNQTYDILGARYNFTKKTELNENVLTLSLNRKIPDITDTLKNTILSIKDIQGEDISTTDLITRYQLGTGSVGIRQSGLTVSTSVVTGSVYYLYATGFVPPINPMHLASGTDQGFLAGSFTGSAVAVKTIIVWSGGYF